LPGSGLDFVHRYVPPVEGGSGRTLLLLHGTGGDETDLLPVGSLLAPGAGLLSPRGNVVEDGMPRFFRRLAPGVFDQEDLAHRTAQLAGFLETASRAYGFDLERVVAAGYSNGANAAGSLLLRRPDLLAAAILFRPMVPFVPDAPVDLAGKPVFLAAGRDDPIVPVGETERVEELYRRCGAKVSLFFGEHGHALREGDVLAAKEWLERRSPVRSRPNS
jgi:predicted esterase